MSHSPYSVESLLSARLFVVPKLDGDRLLFESDLSGRISLYAMRRGGSVPVPLMPGDIALPLPDHVGGESYAVFPHLDRLVVMIDRDGDENYQPFFLPREGGLPVPVFGDRFEGKQCFLTHPDSARNLAILTVDDRKTASYESFIANVETATLTSLGSSPHGNHPLAVSEDFSKIILSDSYLPGDEVLFLWTEAEPERRLLWGKPLAERAPGEALPLLGGKAALFVEEERALLLVTALFDDQYGLARMALDAPDALEPVAVVGLAHSGVGEMEALRPLADERYLLSYNIDGVSWAYEVRYDAASRQVEVQQRLVGEGALANGVLQAIHYDEASDAFALAFSTATAPVQLFTLEGAARRAVRHTDERVLGIPPDTLAPGEDASFISHGGLRISARLYLPAASLSHAAPYPVVYYIHGGPQSQERPDFTWFSMPLIQFLTLNGFAVFVPNARGSAGYGLDYMKHVDRDWGGQDRLDHVAAVAELRQDERLDTARMAVMGRSYGGYMTLSLVGQHPELWKAACNMFGPYNLLTFVDRLPETWKTYFYQALGHPDTDRDFLMERSPSSHIHSLACPMLVIQGQNDPRVVERESHDLVEQLRAQGKAVDYLLFADEGHDVLKFPNKVLCFNSIVHFFDRHLNGA